MALFSQRLPHVLTRSDLVDLLTPTYAREAGISDELAHERMTEALKSQAFLKRIYAAVSTALSKAQGTRTEDDVVDKLSKAVPKRRSNIKAAPTCPGLSAVTVALNIEIGVGTMDLRDFLGTEKGRELLDQGFNALGKFLVGQLVG